MALHRPGKVRHGLQPWASLCGQRVGVGRGEKSRGDWAISPLGTKGREGLAPWPGLVFLALGTQEMPATVRMGLGWKRGRVSEVGL